MNQKTVGWVLLTGSSGGYMWSNHEYGPYSESYRTKYDAADAWLANQVEDKLKL